MNADESEQELSSITERIIGCAYRVSNVLGCGFLEKVYENALAHELQKNGLVVEQQRHVAVLYDGVVVGDYYADLVVAGRVIVEVKSANGIEDAHQAQCLNYLRASGIPLGLVINFGKAKVQVKRLRF